MLASEVVFAEGAPAEGGFDMVKRVDLTGSREWVLGRLLPAEDQRLRLKPDNCMRDRRYRTVKRSLTGTGQRRVWRSLFPSRPVCPKG